MKLFSKKVGLSNRGATLVEYALIASLMTVLALGAYKRLGSSFLSLVYNTIAAALGNAI